MTVISKLNARISVSAQLQLEDIPLIVEKGFKTIINNRPDGESLNQPKSEQLSKIISEYGLKYHYLPVQSSSIAESDVEAFEAVMDNAIGPILAFCRTGTRCAILWSLSEVDNATPQDVLDITRSAGYDLTPITPRLEARRTRLISSHSSDTGPVTS